MCASCPRLKVDDGQRKQLLTLVRSVKTLQRTAQRARLVLMAADGTSNSGGESGESGTVTLLDDDVKARRGGLTADGLQLTASVGCGIRDTPERLAVSRRPIADSVETMMTAGRWQRRSGSPP
jgi:hypothetical protein